MIGLMMYATLSVSVRVLPPPPKPRQIVVQGSTLTVPRCEGGKLTVKEMRGVDGKIEVVEVRCEY